MGSISRDRWSVLEPLLDAALELEPSRRSAFVDGACSTDAVLRAEITALILACERGHTLLSTPATIALRVVGATGERAQHRELKCQCAGSSRAR